MDVTPLFSTELQKLWNLIELRVLVLLSLFLQFVLIFTGNRRKYNNHKIMAGALWFCYLSADAVATLALGVLSQAESESKETVDAKHTITVFWAPFLLMHLGGPDTITAYAMADNELWSRHLLTLIGQVSVALYVFIRSFTPARLNLWWIVVFLAGTGKYGERIWVLYSASRNRYRDSLISDPDPGPNYAKFVDEAASREEEGYKAKPGEAFPPIPPSSPGAPREKIAPAEVLSKADSYFRTFKKLFADLILSFQDRQDSVSYFQTLNSADAFLIVEIELGLVYDLFYTKSPLIFSGIGGFLRSWSLFSSITLFVAFLFMKNDYPETEVIITLILLVGAVFLEIYAIVVLFLSDTMMIRLKQGSAARPGEEKLCKYESLLYRLRLVPARKRWSDSVGQYNLFTHCLRYMPSKHTKLCWCSKLFAWCNLKFRQKLDKYLFWESEPLAETKLKEMVFEKVKRIQAAQGDRKKVDSYWTDASLRKTKCFKEEDEIEFDQSILVWHMATDIIYHTKADTGMSEADKRRREICILVSNYMVHLLMMSPFMLPSGIGQIRFQDTCAEATEFFDNAMGLGVPAACEKLSRVHARFNPSDVKGDRSKSLLFDARQVSEHFEELQKDQKWEDKVGQVWKDITEAWLDMLTFAAVQCSWSDHAEKLSQGGELLTHVWLLMAHFGLTDHFQISKGYMRVKLDLR